MPAVLIAQNITGSIHVNERMLAGHLRVGYDQTALFTSSDGKREGMDGYGATYFTRLKHELSSQTWIWVHRETGEATGGSQANAGILLGAYTKDTKA